MRFYLCIVKQKVKSTIPVYNICSLQNEHQLRSDLIVEPFATYLLAHPNLHVAHRHSFYHIVLFTGGAGKHTIDFEQFEVRPGQIYFMRPGQVHSWAFEGDMDGYIINFSDDIFSKLLADTQFAEQFLFFRGIATQSVIHLDAEAFDQVKRLMENILKESKEKENFTNEMIGALLISLLITVSRNQSKTAEYKAPLHHQLVLQNFSNLVERYFSEKRLPKEYAAMLFITANHLNALCRHLVGKSAGSIIRERILLEAKRLLVNANLPIAEIATELNFTDNSYFTKFFKKHTAQTPEEFRKSSFA